MAFEPRSIVLQRAQIIRSITIKYKWNIEPTLVEGYKRVGELVTVPVSSDCVEKLVTVELFGRFIVGLNNNAVPYDDLLPDAKLPGFPTGEEFRVAVEKFVQSRVGHELVMCSDDPEMDIGFQGCFIILPKETDHTYERRCLATGFEYGIKLPHCETRYDKLLFGFSAQPVYYKPNKACNQRYHPRDENTYDSPFYASVEETGIDESPFCTSLGTLREMQWDKMKEFLESEKDLTEISLIPYSRPIVMGPFMPIQPLMPIQLLTFIGPGLDADKLTEDEHVILDFRKDDNNEYKGTRCLLKNF